jgi:LPS-assembly protein
MDGALGIQKLQHAIEPRVTYNFLDGVDSKDYPQWDGIDIIRPSNLITYSLTNRIKARAVGEEERPGRVWELLRFTLSQTYSIEPEAFVTPLIGAPAPPSDILAAGRRRLAQETEPKRLSDLLADLILEPIYGVQFRGTVSWDPYESRVTAATTDFYYEASRWRAAFGTRHADEGRLVFIQSSLEARIGSRWAVRVSSNYNVDTGTVIENRLEIDFREQCWGITAAFIDRTDEDEFRITVNLLELGQLGFGRAFAGTQ